MSFSKKDRNIQSKINKTILSQRADGLGAAGFAAAISDALRREFGGNGSAIKTIATLTAANERAVRNWFEGRNGPSGAFLLVLCRHSDEVLETVLTLSDRPNLIKAKKFIDAKEKLRDMLELIDQIETE